MEKGKQIVTLQSIFESSEWQNSNARLPFALGKDINGNVVVSDLTHLLIADNRQ
jgi:S-DNA-T family DNA segregation ATPase FtsK/SpoIIIE